LHHLRWLNRVLGGACRALRGLHPWNPGPLAGNLLFEVLLEITLFIGFLPGWRLRIRHVVFSTKPWAAP
jgi:site-specific recombinase